MTLSKVIQKFNLWWVYPLLFFGYSLYSFTQVEVPLFRMSYWWPVLIQAEFWEFGRSEYLISVGIYTLLILLLFGGYWVLLHAKPDYVEKHLLRIFLGSIVCTALAYPSLSRDVFNYLFNAKMVLTYHANPHIRVANEFDDPWLLFMHNVHTPAPYGYGWTLLSLLPYAMTGGSLKVGIIVYKLVMILALVGLVGVQKKLSSDHSWRSVAWFALNPLVLIETVGNIHNDVVMMVIGLASIGLLVNHQKRWGRWVLGGVLFGLSVSIKYATILLIPAYGLYKLLAAKKQKLSWGTIGSISQMLPLLTSQSKWFLPWYLIWPMSLEPMGISIIWKRVLGLFTMTGLLSYIPYLLIGGYSDTQQWQRLVILWLLPLLYLGYEWVNRLLSRRDL